MIHSKRKTQVKIDELLKLQSMNIGMLGLLFELEHDIDCFKGDSKMFFFLKTIKAKIDDVTQLAKNENEIIGKYDPLRFVDFKKKVARKFQKFQEQLTLFGERSKRDVRFIIR